MVADRLRQARFRRTALHQVERFPLAQAVLGELAAAAPARAEQGRFLLPADAGGVQVGVQVLLGCVMHRHLVELAALLVQADPPALAVLVIVLNLHSHDRAYPRETEHHQPDQSAIAQADDVAGVYAVQQAPYILFAQDWRLALLDAILRPPDAMGWVHRHDLADHQPIEQHPDRRQRLFHRLLFAVDILTAHLLDIGRDRKGPDLQERRDAMRLAPGEEPHDLASIRPARVLVADVGGEEFKEALLGALASALDDAGKCQRLAAVARIRRQ